MGGAHQMASKAMGHTFQRCMSDSDSDGEEEEGCAVPQASKSRNVYRSSAKRAMKANFMLGLSKLEPGRACRCQQNWFDIGPARPWANIQSIWAGEHTHSASVSGFVV